MDVFALRGATTVAEDAPQLIDEAVGEMIECLLRENNLEEKNLVSVLFSQTKDLRSKNAAAACRKAGYCSSVPLFCVQEADTEGALEKAIRVLITVKAEARDVKMAYLRGASNLRPDLKK